MGSSITIPTKQSNKTLEVFQPRSSVVGAVLTSKISPRLNNAQSSDDGVPKQGARGLYITQDANFAAVNEKVALSATGGKDAYPLKRIVNLANMVVT